MKQNTMRNTMIVVLLALASAMQATAVNYQNSYRGLQSADYKVQTISVQTTAPSATFQSTSAFSDQWNQDAQQSTLNSDGTVNEGAYVGHRPHIRKDGPGGSPGSSPGTPGGQLDPNAQQPLGDGLWVLLMLACMYALMRVVLNRKRALNG